MTDDSKQLASGLADTLLRAAEEQVTKAQTMMDQTRALVEIMQTQMTAHAKATEDMNARFREVGSIMLDAHRILNGNEAAGLERVVGNGADAVPDHIPRNSSATPVSDPARRGSLAGAGAGPLGKIAGLGPLASVDVVERANDASYPAGYGQLPRAVGGVSQFDPRAANRHGANRDDPGTDHSKP